ncbi:MAG: hypothetical protein IH897_03150 [Planctomycetes bacterium]|nr:hypothetical protein [Planctomycetota bacterium]
MPLNGEEAVRPMTIHTLELLGSLASSMVLGTALLVVASAVGWLLASFHRFFLVRWVNYWVKHVVIPLLGTPSWPRRTLIIFANNSLILAAVVQMGCWRVSSWIGVILVGLSLGAALRQLGAHVADSDVFTDPSTPSERRRLRFGVALNLLEVAAIVVTVGLAVGLPELKIPLAQAWKLFGYGVVPTLLVAAGGESLWMGVIWKSSRNGKRRTPDLGPKSPAVRPRDETD